MTADYISDAEFRAYIKDGSALEPDAVSAAITAASRAVDAFCDRVFDDAGVVSARKYVPRSGYEVETDDFSTTTGLIVAVDRGYDETYSTTLTIGTQYRAEPVNQARGGLDWPYDSLTAAGIALAYVFPIPVVGRPYTVRVTARWGWATVPEPVKQATKVMAALYYKMGEAPFGTAGFGEYGMLRVRDNPVASNLLRPYRAGAGRGRMNPADVCTAITASLSVIPDVHLYDYPCDEPNTPSFMVIPRLITTEGFDFSTATYTILGLAASTATRAGHLLLCSWLATDGAQSVKAALEADNTFGGAVDSAQVLEASEEPAVVLPDGRRYFGARWQIETYAH